jgi:hypothetical protein
MKHPWTIHLPQAITDSFSLLFSLSVNGEYPMEGHFLTIAFGQKAEEWRFLAFTWTCSDGWRDGKMKKCIGVNVCQKTVAFFIQSPNLWVAMLFMRHTIYRNMKRRRLQAPGYHEGKGIVPVRTKQCQRWNECEREHLVLYSLSFVPVVVLL